MAAPVRNHQSTFEEIVGRLYSAGSGNVADVLASASDAQKARLALFCYERAHMRAIGLAVAATCDEATLIQVGGKLGEAIYAQARAGSVPAAAPSRRGITLATPTPTMPLIVDEDPDPEFYAEAG